MPQPSRETVARVLAASAAGVGVVLSARALLRPQTKTTERQLIDWEIVRQTAVERSGERLGSGLSSDEAGRLGALYTGMAEDLAPLLGEVCNDTPFEPPRFVALDRRGFIDVNIAIVRRLLDPVEKLRATLPDSIATNFGRRLMDRYIGELMGMMARRVLGQYDPVLSLAPPDSDLTTAQPALYLVEPNINAIQREQNVPGEALRRWLILHELTHAWQFGQHPWLREHIVGITQSLLTESLTADGSRFLDSQEMLKRLPQTVRTQMRTVSRVQAVMSVLEGYSNFVMHSVGKRHLARHDDLEAAMHRRREQRTLFERLVMALTGLELKMRQYEIGEQFCDAVVKRSDLATLNRVWESAEMMPTMAELKKPETWVARVRQTPATAS
jgi:coenzyme F420 biosynthesis associated uncharacterized protein